MAATKQFLLNYDSNILLPYTTIDCILGSIKEGEDPDSSGPTGMDVITDNLLKNIKEFIYNTTEPTAENQIKRDKISSAYVLGISTLNDSSAQVYTKFHKLSLDSSAYSGKYLGADGSSHDISFGAKDDNGWYSTSINVRPSNELKNPIKADVSININISKECFDTSDGYLYSKYSTNAAFATDSGFADYANKIASKDSSTGNIELNTTGNNKRPVYVNNGVLTVCDASIGSFNTPMYYDPSQGFTKCTGSAGSADTLGYIENGEFKTSTKTIGENLKKPIYMDNGVLTEFDRQVPTFDGAPIGNTTNGDTVGSAQPVYIDSSGIVKPITATACSVDSNSLLALSNGTFSKQNGRVGNASKPVYVDGGTITAFSETIGSVTKPVYLDKGTISVCELTPSSITGADAADGGTLFLQSINGKKQWAEGNRTTKGNFEIDPDNKYYLVGIFDNNVNGDSFTCLTGAKNISNGTGIYFKNYELFQTSDENLKTFTDEIDINFDNLATIKKGIYHWSDDPNKILDIGIGARSLEALYPEIVDENNGVKTVAYNRLGVIALAAIDKLHLRIKELETKMKELKAEIRALKQGE